MKKNELLLKAKKLREKGYSLGEISKILDISKSTASIWLVDVVLSKKGKERLEKIKLDAAKKTKIYKKEQKEKYLKKIEEDCSALSREKKFTINDYKIFLALLFWGEGSKGDRRLIFMNSDPKMIKAYLFLLRTAYRIDEKKFRGVIHLHEYHNKNKQVDFWSRVTGIDKKLITVYQKDNTGIRKKDNYQGCISIRYGDVRILDELFLIIKRFNNKIVAGVG